MGGKLPSYRCAAEQERGRVGAPCWYIIYSNFRCMWTIYFLFDTHDPTTGYVGQTKRSPEYRLRQHLSQSRNGNPLPVCAWIRRVLDAGRDLSCDMLGTCESLSDANVQEREWIATKAASGLTLLNRTQGGQGPYGPDFGKCISLALQRPETRKRKAAASAIVTKAGWDDAAGRARRVAALRAAWNDPAKRAARLAKVAAVRADATRGREWSENHRAALRSPELRAKISERSKAFARREDVRRKVGAASKARWSDPAMHASIRKKISDGWQRRIAEGRPRKAVTWSEERKAAHRALLQARNANPDFMAAMHAAKRAKRAVPMD